MQAKEDADKTTQRTCRMTDDEWDGWLTIARRLGQAGRAEAIRLLGRAAARCPASALAAVMAGMVDLDESQAAS